MLVNKPPGLQQLVFPCKGDQANKLREGKQGALRFFFCAEREEICGNKVLPRHGLGFLRLRTSFPHKLGAAFRICNRQTTAL